MRSFVLGVLLIPVAGCATVSMIPGETTVEAGMTAEQSSLREASDAFCETAHAEGWALNSNGLANLATLLMHGQNAVQANEASYLETIGAETAAPSTVIETIARDASEARLGLARVTAEALVLLSDPAIETARADVTSFERALVRAQRANRNFTSAFETVAERTSETQLADSALAAFEDEIDDARRVADDLAARYASIDDATV